MTSTARLYGGSLYELAAGEGLADLLLEQTKEVREIFRENPDYVRLLAEPSIPKKERTELIEAAFGGQAERYLLNFLKLLCERGILNEYLGCCDEFVRRYNADHNIAEAVVTSAVKLSGEQMNALRQKLEQLTGKQIRLKQITDVSVLGGVRVELEGRQLDGTVRGRLSGISRKLNEVMV